MQSVHRTKLGTIYRRRMRYLLGAHQERADRPPHAASIRPRARTTPTTRRSATRDTSRKRADRWRHILHHHRLARIPSRTSIPPVEPRGAHHMLVWIPGATRHVPRRRLRSARLHSTRGRARSRTPRTCSRVTLQGACAIRTSAHSGTRSAPLSITT